MSYSQDMPNSRIRRLAVPVAGATLLALFAGHTQAMADSLTVAPTVSRISGADRYEVSASVAAQLKVIPRPVVFITTGETFPDALSAGPATMSFGAQLLLVTRDTVPDPVVRMITEIDPAYVQIIGGTNSISSSVYEKIASLTAPGTRIERVDGADRYEVSRNVIVHDTLPLRHQLHVATGANFPDALSAGAAAALHWNPMMLVPGGVPTLDRPTRETLSSLSLSGITVVGGERSVSPGVVSELGTIAPVSRAGGVDRYAASVAINKQTFTSATRAYLATGLNYPDALTGGVLAGQNDSPLYIVPGTCVPPAVLDEFSRLGVTDVVLIGGPASLSPAVERLEPCS